MRTGIGSLKAGVGAGLVAALSLGGIVAGVASPASASSASKAAAQMCHKGGWKDLAPNNASPAFTSRKQCVTYAKQVGTPVPFNPNWASQGT